MTSPGFCAEPLGMFSLDGIAAITLIFGLSCAITFIVARIDGGAAHVVLHRLHALRRP